MKNCAGPARQKAHGRKCVLLSAKAIASRRKYSSGICRGLAVSRYYRIDHRSEETARASAEDFSKSIFRRNETTHREETG